MRTKISSIIQAKELLDLQNDNNIIIAYVGGKSDFEENYQKKHLAKAIFVDLDTQLAEKGDNPANGGRHPLPKIEDFAKTLKELGITNSSHVILYDDAKGAAAARFWWMLKAIGQEKVQVLDGGIQEAEKVGFPTNNKIELPKVVENYTFDHWKLPTVSINEVEQNSLKEDYLVLDVRANNRYRGEVEPIDLKAGHIPGAINVPLSENLDENGLFLSSDLLKQKYEKVFGNIDVKNIIVHCGSGVAACHTLLALDYAGLEIPKLYVGSWSEWSVNNKPIEVDR